MVLFMGCSRLNRSSAMGFMLTGKLRGSFKDAAMVKTMDSGLGSRT